jgi:hypothetical protein
MIQNNNYLIVILICLFILLIQNVAFTRFSIDSTEQNYFKSFVAGLSSSILLSGFVFKDKKLFETTRIMIESFLI